MCQRQAMPLYCASISRSAELSNRRAPSAAAAGGRQSFSGCSVSAQAAPTHRPIVAKGALQPFRSTAVSTAKTCCRALYSAHSLSRACCRALQLYSALQRSTFYSSTASTLYSALQSPSVSNNTAELRAMIEGLRYARKYGKGQPHVIRYDSKYAAMIATNVWRARKNKSLAKEAQAEWQRTMRALKGKLWLKHVKGHSDHKWNDRADELADQGRGGKLRTAAPPLVVD